jgi:hypothetical protein
VSALDNVLSRLQNVRQEGSGYKASCPNPKHGQGRGDRDPSLSVGVNDYGDVILNCFAGCDKAEIINAAGLEWTDLFEQDFARNGHQGEGGFISPRKLGQQVNGRRSPQRTQPKRP